MRGQGQKAEVWAYCIGPVTHILTSSSSPSLPTSSSIDSPAKSIKMILESIHHLAASSWKCLL